MENVKPKLKLVGLDGNAFFILARANQSARRAGWSEEKRKEVMDEARSGDYDHLLQTMLEHFDCD